jgi:hypothetical protein
VHPWYVGLVCAHQQVLVEGPRPNLVPPLRPLADLRKLLLDVRRSLPMSAEVRLTCT